MESIQDTIRNAILDMMAKVKFIEKGGQHRYETTDGEWLQGISTVSSIIPKDWLSAWGAKEAVKALGYSDYEGDHALALEVMDKIRKCVGPDEYIAILKEAKGASGRKSKAALIDGKKGHEWLENYVKAKIRGTPLPEMPLDALKRPLEQFVEWETTHIASWLLSEARVAYPTKGYAGTLDGLAILKDGKLAVIDFKFASHISEDYYLQTAGYQACFEPYGINIAERIIIRLPKTLEIEEWDKKTFKYKMIPNNIEVRRVDTLYENDRDVFFACLPVKRWINQFKK